MTKEEYIEQQRSKEQSYLNAGYTLQEIREGYLVAKEMGVKYLDKFKMKQARKRLNKQKNGN